eukprot:38019_1
MSATVLLLVATLISIQYCVGLTHDESEAVELLEKYNVGHLWYALQEAKFDDISLWSDIDQDMLKNMNVLDSDRVRFKNLQNELIQRNQSNWTNIIGSLNSGVVASIIAFISVTCKKYEEMKAFFLNIWICFASLFPMNEKQIVTDTPCGECEDETKTTTPNSKHNPPKTNYLDLLILNARNHATCTKTTTPNSKHNPPKT